MRKKLKQQPTTEAFFFSCLFFLYLFLSLSFKYMAMCLKFHTERENCEVTGVKGLEG